MKVLCSATKKESDDEEDGQREREHPEGTYKERKHEKSQHMEKNKRETYEKEWGRSKWKFEQGDFFVDKEYQNWDRSRENGICFQKKLKNKVCSDFPIFRPFGCAKKKNKGNEIFCRKRSKQKENGKNKTSMKQTDFVRKKEWLQEGKNKEIHKGNKEKKRIIKDPAQEMKDKWRKTIKKRRR